MSETGGGDKEGQTSICKIISYWDGCTAEGTVIHIVTTLYGDRWQLHLLW